MPLYVYHRIIVNRLLVLFKFFYEKFTKFQFFMYFQRVLRMGVSNLYSVFLSFDSKL